MIAKRNFKGQFWSFDVIFAIVIFTVSLTILAYTWFNINSQLALAYGNGGTVMELQAQTLAHTLLSTGYPANWQSLVNTTNASTWGSVSIGLVNRQGTTAIAQNKLYTFMAMENHSYEATKQALGIGYAYFIIISGKNINVTIGHNPSKYSALTTFVTKEQGTLGNQPVNIQIDVWTNKPIAVS